ncbi:MAG TPA: hypothetical protein PK514_10775 [Spirochaetota bacterium]|nr:hypothetical protein [Spirochaetota bacterium]
MIKKRIVVYEKLLKSEKCKYGCQVDSGDAGYLTGLYSTLAGDIDGR